nr:DNA topoisomerase [uncultured Pedobacter sp.]
MITVIAEKPSVAKDLARIMGATQSAEGHIKGKNIAFTWAYGHLIQLAMPDAYGFNSFSDLSQLPMIPGKFKLVPKQVKKGKEYIDEPGAKKQLNIIKSLLKDSTKIIVATDAGREGELIFRYIYEYLDCTLPFERLWISSQTDEAVLTGFKTLQPGTNYDTLYYAAKCRSEADWLIGLNATRALSGAANTNKTLSIGRVQTPTLAMVCKRYIDHSDFKVSDYYKISITCSKNGVDFSLQSKDDYEQIDQVNKIKASINHLKICQVVEAEHKPKTENPPKLYDLTSLQREASRKLNFNPDQTLQIAQTLYEGKLITYPRTGSSYIGEDVFKTVPSLIDKLIKLPNYSTAGKNINLNELNKGSVNDNKVTDHHALLPTNQNFDRSSLKSDQLALYDLIVFRFLESFAPKCMKSVYTVIIESAGVDFRGSSVKTISAGWRGIQNEPVNNIDEDEQLVISIPELDKGETLAIINTSILSKKTKPKPLLTMDTLLEMMENCGRKIEDEQQREAMKDLGLGTPATRAAIITTLFTREYVATVKKNSIIPTALGLSVYNLIKDKPVGNPVLTGHWEQKLEEIRIGKYPAQSFMKAIHDYTNDITKGLLSLNTEQSKSLESAINADKVICPKCKKGFIRINDKVASCSEQNSGCEFKIFRTIAGKKINDAQLSSLLTKGKTAIIKGFTGKNQKTFDAALSLKSDFTIEFVFPKTKK